ncbi:hypothetical protein OIU83_21165 [Flavobacterium sp. LS1R49]|uniref:YobI-like P-loop NTPase domain-containing protein n=1 Tax=Flavobacterium shii TaxID=2987687 RepID=A0A9X2ZK49_9FLAO|nr:hypothetical protein [Flavobacterium shii]MCV9930182.1 hypothetical protein [Flavobacterium shii]
MNVFVLLISELNKLAPNSEINKRKRKIKKATRILLMNKLSTIIHLLSKWQSKLNKTKNFTNLQNYEDFTPSILNEQEDKYGAIIKYSIENPNTKNVALTGPYGSGKSSILKTFENKNFEYKYLNISLATFDEKVHQIKEIEFCILKQLFYKVEQNKIPESRFKRIVNQKNVTLKSVYIFLWLISATYFLRPSLLNDITKNLSLDFHSKVGNFIYTIYFLTGIIYLLYKIMGFILNFKLTKFNFQDAEIENGDDKKSVSFENEIDEILYFFERNTFNVVFIEDLDRFKNTEIFIKLREINYLINNYDPIKNKRKITFIYAVQNDTFKEDERAKFFDFIIPVIPVINYSNSSVELLDKIDIKEDEIPKIFIKQVARYLSDKRTLISINNEYKVYKKIIGNDLDKTKLLAMMIYKNVEPTDFDNLNCQKGYVNSVFNDSNKLIKKAIANIDKEIIKANTKIDNSIEETIQNVNELRSLYIAKFYGKLLNSENKNILNIQINNTQCPIKQLLLDSNFNLFSNLNDIYYYTYNRFQGGAVTENSGISFKTLESEVGLYAERLEIIENKKHNKINEFKKEIEKLESEKQVLKTKKIKDIVTDEYLKKCLDSMQYKKSINTKETIDGKETIITSEIIVTPKVNNYDLINFLIRYGHIDESYSHYISYFYPGSITKEDNDFLKSFTNNKPLPYVFKLQEIENLFPDILESDFSREEILNFSLLDYIIERNNTDKQLNQIITLLSTKIIKPVTFIDEYLSYAKDVNKKFFFQALCKNWKNTNQNIWEELISNLSDDKLIEYLNFMFSKLDLSTLQSLNIRNSISNYISEMDSLDLFRDIDTEITVFISKNNIKFKKLNDKGSKTILDFIYQNNNYIINYDMIELFTYLYKENEIDFTLLKSENYTTITNSGAMRLKSYIDENIEEYLENVFQELETNNNESEETIIKILNQNIKPEIKVEIIYKNQNLITNLSTIEDTSIWNILLEADKVVTSWNNLLHYFKTTESFDDTLINYLNTDEHSKELKYRIDKNYKEDIQVLQKFTRELLQSNISTNTFTILATHSTIPYSYSNGITYFNEISIEKMKILIENKILILTVENYNFIQNNFRNLLIILLETNIHKFLNNIKTYSLDSEIILELLGSLSTSGNETLIIGHIQESILLGSVELLNTACHYLSINHKIVISKELLKELLSKTKSQEDKIKLFNLYYNDIERTELESIIQLLGEPYSSITKGKVTKFLNTDYNLKFVTILEINKMFISSKSITEDGKMIKANLKTNKK